jgi:fumarate reductase subunit C
MPVLFLAQRATAFVLAFAVAAHLATSVLREWMAWRSKSLDVALVLFALLLLMLGLRAVFAVFTL